MRSRQAVTDSSDFTIGSPEFLHALLDFAFTDEVKAAPHASTGTGTRGGRRSRCNRRGSTSNRHCYGSPGKHEGIATLGKALHYVEFDPGDGDVESVGDRFHVLRHLADA